MKHLRRFILLVLCLLPGILISQQWRQALTYSYPNFNGCVLVDALTGFAVGAEGGIYKTTDGGVSWVKMTSGTTSELLSIWFLNENVGYIGGAKRLFLKTTDGGSTWTSKTITAIPETTVSIKSLQFLDENTGFILTTESSKNGRVMKSTDGGSTWTTVLYGSAEEYNDISMNGSNGVMVGKNVSTLYYTTDKGSTWTKAPAPTLGGINYTRSDIRAVHLVTQWTGYAVGWGSFAAGLQPSIHLKTTDGGKTWTLMVQDSAQRTYDNLWSVCMADSLNGFAGGGSLRGTVLVKTTDGGVHWIIVDNAPLGATMNGVSYFGGRFIFCGDGGMIGWTTNMGANGGVATPIPSGTLYTMQFTTNNVGFAAGYNSVLLKTTNAGANWSGHYLRANGLSPNIQDIHFLSDKIGYAACSYRMVAKTTDGGDEWTMILSDTMYASSYSYGVWFTDENHGTVVGQQKSGTDVIFTTTNGGTTWKPLYGLTTKTLRDVAYGSWNKGTAIGDAMKVASTTDGGSTWKSVAPTGVPTALASNNLRRVAYVDSNTAFAVGNKVILRSVNGGVNWAFFDSTSYDMYDVKFLPRTTDTIGYIAGSRFAMKSTNAGRNWAVISDTSVIQKTIYSLGIDPSGNIWAGSLTSIVYTNAPVSGVYNLGGEIPKGFYVEQNYPNPFNPVTTIKFGLGSSGKVTLRVYDLLGRVVRVLVDEHKTAGNYEVNFNAVSLSSGVYFYELSQGRLKAFRKMALVK